MQRTPRGEVQRNRDFAKHLQGYKQCPLTAGGPTTMTDEGFRAACERSREQDKHNFYAARSYKYTWCDTCQGEQRPKELRIVSLKKLKMMRFAEMRKRKSANAGTFAQVKNTVRGQ